MIWTLSVAGLIPATDTPRPVPAVKVLARTL